MATSKTKTKVSKAKTRSKAKTSAAAKRAGGARKQAGAAVAGLDLGKYFDEVRIGGFSLDDMLAGANKNMEAIADANRAIIDGYTDIAKRQYEMLKDLLDELRKVSGDRSDVVKELKRVVEHARKDLNGLQKMATQTNQQAQKIVKRRADANIKAWKKLLDDAKKAAGKAPAKRKKAAAKKKKASVKRKSAAKKKTPVKKKKAAAKKKAAPRKKAASKKKAAPKKKAASSTS